MKRQRGRNRSGSVGQNGAGGGNKPQQNANRAFDSNGPENVKVRGHAQSVYEKYQQLARDAFSSGDRVLAENYLQHAEHYFRVLRLIQPGRSTSEIVARDVFASGFDIDFEEEGGDYGADSDASATEAAPESVNGGYDSRDDRGEGWQERPRYEGPRAEGPRSEGQRGDDRGDRNGADRGQGGQNDRYQNDRPQPDRGQGDRGQGDRGQGDRGQGDRGQGDRGQGDRFQSDGRRNDRPQGERFQSDRYQGDRAPADRSANDRPQADRPQADRQPAERQQGDRQPADRFQGDRPRRDDRDRNAPRGERAYGRGEPRPASGEGREERALGARGDARSDRSDRVDRRAEGPADADREFEAVRSDIGRSLPDTPAALAPSAPPVEAIAPAYTEPGLEPSASPRLRSEDGGSSEAPAFLSAPTALPPSVASDVPEQDPAPVRRPRGRPRRRPVEAENAESTATPASDEV